MLRLTEKRSYFDTSSSFLLEETQKKIFLLLIKKKEGDELTQKLTNEYTDWTLKGSSYN